jgi:hypothetical protein
VLCGGDVLKGEGFDNGAWVAPTVFTDCTDEMTIVREEIFGPVMSILTYETKKKRFAAPTTPTTAWRPASSRRPEPRPRRHSSARSRHLLDQHLG